MFGRNIHVPLFAMLIAGALPVHAETVGEMIDLSNEKALLSLKVEVQEKRNKLEELQTKKTAAPAAVATPAGMPPLPQPGNGAFATLPPISTDDDIKIVSVSGFDDDLYADASCNGVTTTISSKNKGSMAICGWKIDKIDRTQVAFSKGSGKKAQHRVVYLSSTPPSQSADQASVQPGLPNTPAGMPRF